MMTNLKRRGDYMSVSHNLPKLSRDDRISKILREKLDNELLRRVEELHKANAKEQAMMNKQKYKEREEVRKKINYDYCEPYDLTSEAGEEVEEQLLNLEEEVNVKSYVDKQGDARPLSNNDTSNKNKKIFVRQYTVGSNSSLNYAINKMNEECTFYDIQSITTITVGTYDSIIVVYKER